MNGPLVIAVTGPPGTGKSTIADVIGNHVVGAVVGWDWVMGGIAQTREMIPPLQSLDAHRYLDLGWNVMFNVAVAQVRAGRSVVLDGIARQPQLDALRALVAVEKADLLTIATFCSDRAVHRTRVSGRRREIPGWHELEWPFVEQFLSEWHPPETDLRLDATAPLDDNTRDVIEHLRRRAT